MSHFIHYKYKPKILNNIKYNSILKNYLYSYKSNDLLNIVLYGPSGSGKKHLFYVF